jgi:hypothetical protein
VHSIARFLQAPRRGATFVKLVGELLAITNRTLCEPDLTSCEATRVVPRVRIPPSPPYSLDRRETPPNCSRNRKKSPKFRDSHPQTGLEKATRQTECGNFGEFFSGQQKRSPVSTRTLGRMQCDHKSTMRPRRVDSTHGKTSHFLTKARRRKDLDSIEARRERSAAS